MKNERERIIANSRMLFLEKGCRAVTMDDVASANRISKRTLYEVFRDKSELLAECIRQTHREYEKRLSELEETSANTIEFFLQAVDFWRSTRFFMEKQFGFIMELKKYYYPVFEEVGRMITDSNVRMVRNLVVRGREDGCILDGYMDSDTFADLLVGALRVSNSLLTEKRMESSPKYDPYDMVVFTVRGISTRKGIEIIDNYLKNRTK